jgi:uncharacterized protein (DUF1330 family)
MNAREDVVPKGYWIPHLDVSNPEGYKAYMAATPEAHRKYHGHALVRGGTCETVEGKARSRNVLREFPDYATALACYRSPEYQSAKPLRQPHSVCDFVIVEGYDGAQPPLPNPPPHSASEDARERAYAGEGREGAAPPAAARKGYWIGHVDVHDPEGYKPYQAANGAAFSKFGGRFLVRGGAREVVEGKVRGRTVVLEFPSYQAALACYRSPEYQAAAALRKGKADLDMFIIEGYDGPQS